MKRATLLIGLLACGLVATSAPSFAQTAPAAPIAPPGPSYWSNWFNGDTTLLVLGHDNPTSSKFQEYREVREGVTMPTFTLQGSQNGKNFAVFGQKVSQTDQRYVGKASVAWFGVKFDYNQIPHNMGNDGWSILTNTAPGEWSMSTTRAQDAADGDREPADRGTHLGLLLGPLPADHRRRQPHRPDRPAQARDHPVRPREGRADRSRADLHARGQDGHARPRRRLRPGIHRQRRPGARGARRTDPGRRDSGPPSTGPGATCTGRSRTTGTPTGWEPRSSRTRWWRSTRST